MKSRSRVVWSNVTATTGSATIKLGIGEWEISALSVIMQEQGATMDGAQFGAGYVTLEILDDSGYVIESHYLVDGYCTFTKPLLMTHPARLQGPAQVKSYIQHGGSSTYGHKMSMVYRRVRTE